jgi:hypothetical protein
MTGERVFCSRLKRKVPTNRNPPRHRREPYSVPLWFNHPWAVDWAAFPGLGDGANEVERA